MNIQDAQRLRYGAQKVEVKVYPDWIDIDLKRPELGVAVLICLKSDLVTIGYRAPKNGSVFWQLYGPIEDIIDLKEDSLKCWMPLPEPPTSTNF